MTFNEPTTLGRTGLKVGRLGVATSYRAPAEAYLEAFDRGCNYLTWGTFIKGRDSELVKAVKTIKSRGQRDQLLLGILSYAHSALLTDFFYKRGLKALGLDYADVLILGYYSSPPSQRVLAGARRLKEKGLVRYIGMTGHKRSILPDLAREGTIDIFHVRYNAVHSGAEKDVFPLLPEDNKPGIVSFTATSWGQLMKQKKMPDGETAASAVDCYRYALSNPAVDVCMTGPKSAAQLKENLALLDSSPMSEEELARMRRIGDYIYGKPRK